MQTDVRSLRPVWNVQIHTLLDTYMHGVPASEGVATRLGAINTSPDAKQTIRQFARRHSRSLAGITRFHISIDDCGSFHKMAGSHTSERHFCTHVCSSILINLGFAIWCAVYIDK